MTDLRQGVTPTQHAVLDLIDRKAVVWSAQLNDLEARLRLAAARAKNAERTTNLKNKRAFAIEAAARLIDVADEIGRLIGAEDE